MLTNELIWDLVRSLQPTRRARNRAILSCSLAPAKRLPFDRLIAPRKFTCQVPFFAVHCRSRFLFVSLLADAAMRFDNSLPPLQGKRAPVGCPVASYMLPFLPSHVPSLDYKSGHPPTDYPIPHTRTVTARRIGGFQRSADLLQPWPRRTPHHE